MEGITLEMLFRRERELVGAVTEVKSMIGYIQAQIANEKEKEKKEKKRKTEITPEVTDGPK
jgi:hypothetical protein